jgi:dTDP-4-amino-4,6-dideoxygalactose transaminase
MSDILKKREELSRYYDRVLANLRVGRQRISDSTRYNYSYYPVVFGTAELLQKSLAELNKYQVFPRRYFYPSLDTLNYVGSQQCPVSRDIAERILCLPLYHELSFEEIDMIARILLRAQNS